MAKVRGIDEPCVLEAIMSMGRAWTSSKDLATIMGYPSGRTIIRDLRTWNRLRVLEMSAQVHWRMAGAFQDAVKDGLVLQFSRSGLLAMLKVSTLREMRSIIEAATTRVVTADRSADSDVYEVLWRPGGSLPLRVVEIAAKFADAAKPGEPR